VIKCPPTRRRYVLDTICSGCYNARVWDIEATDQFVEWWDSLTVEEQQSVSGPVGLLERHGPSLGRPLVDSLTASRHPNMKELRAGTMRVLFAFNPTRTAILLIGGDKRDRWQDFYTEMIPIADDLFDEHLTELETEGGA
jgi:hypothetical protein